MKQLFENWRKHLNEDEHRQEELEEAMPRWLKKLGAGAALAGTLAGVGGPAMAQDTESYSSKSPQSHQVDSQSETEVNKLVDNGDGTGSITFEFAGAGGGDIGNEPAQDLFGFTDVKFLKVTGTLTK